MKTKYLFYSLAIASAFAACSQEELVESTIVKDNAAARPVAGLVEFSTEGVDSRFNYEKANGFELGDVFGLYLMDEFVDGNAAFESNHKAEHANANTTYWQYQNHWFGMYNFTNSIQSNYPFRYVAEGGKNVWKNDAKLVEGNYFAMFPQNEKALNRRELWHVIDPSVELKKVSSSTSSNLKYQNVENQLWLGYKQIYRDATASAEGVMKMNLDMTGVLVPMKFIINNNSNNDVIVDKITFKSIDGRALPTLAYVRPDQNNEWSESADKKNANYGWVKMDAADAEAVCNDKMAHYLYNESKTWTKQTIQSIVEWSVVGKNLPYGLDEEAAKSAYEYSFTYPADVKLAGGVNGGSLLTTYIVVPAMETEEEWNNLKVSIYGWQKDNASATGWVYGMLTTTKAADDDNYSFDLSEKLGTMAEQAEETNYYREINVKFSEFAWKAVNQTIEVSTTSDMEKMVNSYLAQNSGNVELIITPDAAGNVEVTSAFVAALKEDSKNKGRKIQITFSGERNGILVFNDNNTMGINTTTTETADKVEFIYAEGIKLYNRAAEQIIPEEYNLSNTSVIVINEANLTVEGYVANVTNNGTMAVANAKEVAGVGTINNWGDLTLGKNANVEYLNNYDAAVVTAAAGYVTELRQTKNDIECGTCAAPVLNVTGTLTVNRMENYIGTTNVTGKLTSETYINNDDLIVNEGSIVAGTINNNNGKIENSGSISATLRNNKTVNAKSGSVIESLEQKNANAVVNVYAEDVEIRVLPASTSGKIVFKGVVAGHVDNSNITKVFEVAEEETLLSLVDKMQRTGSTQVVTNKNITFNALLKADGTVDNVLVAYIASIVKIDVTGNVVFQGADRSETWTLPNAYIVVANNCQLTIANATTINVAGKSGNIHVETGSALNGAQVDHNGQQASQQQTVTGDM